MCFYNIVPALICDIFVEITMDYAKDVHETSMLHAQREYEITCMLVHVTHIELGRLTCMIVRVTLMDLGHIDAL